MPKQNQPYHLYYNTTKIPSTNLLRQQYRSTKDTSHTKDKIPTTIKRRNKTKTRHEPDPIPPYTKQHANFREKATQLLQQPLPQLRQNL